MPPKRENRTRQVRRRLDVKRAADLKRPRSWAVYGRSGSGKTTFASTFPGPKLLIDIRDEGTDSVTDVEDLDVFVVEEFDQLEDAYWFLKENPTKYKTVILDTMSQAQQLLVDGIGEKKNLKGKQAGDWGTLTKQDWGTIAGKLKTLILNYRDLEAEIVFIAQDRVFNVDDEEDDEGSIAPEVGPGLSPSVSKHLCASVSIIVNNFVRSRMEKIEVKGRRKPQEREVIEYCIRLGPNASYITKVRKPKSTELPGAIANPDYDKVIQLIEGTKNATTQKVRNRRKARSPRSGS